MYINICTWLHLATSLKGGPGSSVGGTDGNGLRVRLTPWRCGDCEGIEAESEADFEGWGEWSPRDSDKAAGVTLQIDGGGGGGGGGGGADIAA